MIKQQGIKTKLKSRQQGAVAIIVALSLVVLIGMLGLVLDLGHLYVTKTELQNAADAAALSGAKELDGTALGICCGDGTGGTKRSAVFSAREAAGKNKYDLGSKEVTITALNNIEFSNSPDGPWVSVATAQASPANKTFIKVDTKPGTGIQPLNTWFIQVFSGASSMRTYGMAVAGKFEVDVAPVATCKLPSDPDPSVPNELGYERGVSYALKDTNPINPGTMYWIEPSTNEPGECPTSSADGSRPFMCTGKILFTPIITGTVNTNTGITDNQREALDSRFPGSNYNKSKCDPVVTPPDRNVKEYFWDNPVNAGSPSDWMQTNPNRQSLQFVEVVEDGKKKWIPKPHAQRLIADYGVLWSAYRPKDATVSQWKSLYGEDAANYPTPLDSYPGSSPYAQTSSSSNPEYYQEDINGVPGRRVLNMVILDCEKVVGNGCAAAPVLGIGEFFMPRKANVNTDKDIYMEFSRLLPTPFPPSEIRLYK